MAFGKTPTTTTQTGLAANQFPASSVAVPNHAGGDLTGLEGGPASTDSNGNETAPASVYSKDGANVTMGLSTDANTANSLMGRLTKIRDLLAATINVAVTNANTNGQATMSNSSPVVLASDQTVVPVRRTAATIFALASTITTGTTQNSSDLPVGPYTEIGIDITTTAQSGTSPTIQYVYERKGADNVYYPLWQSAVLTVAANTLSTSIGAGMAYNQSLGVTGRLRWVIGGSATPTYTHSINIYGK